LTKVCESVLTVFQNVSFVWVGNGQCQYTDIDGWSGFVLSGLWYTRRQSPVFGVEVAEHRVMSYYLDLSVDN